MNTSHLFAGSVAVSMAVLASQAAAHPLDATGRVWFAAQAAAQSPKSKATSAERQESDKLVAAARQAMSDGRLETADSLLSRAESLRIDYGLFHLGDSPKKARHDLDLKRRGQRGGLEKPSHKFKPAGNADDDSQQAPQTAAHMGSTSPIDSGRQDGAPTTQDRDSLPALDRRDAAMTRAGLARPATLAPTEEPANEGGAIRPSDNPNAVLPASGALEVRRQSDALLVDARKALAGGDVRRATSLVEQAKQLKVAYGFHDDSPAKIESLVQKYQQVAQLEAGRGGSEAARRQRAELLMEQAEQLLRWQEFDEAERLAADAAALRVTFGPFDANPQGLSTRIAAERKKRGHDTATTATPAGSNGATAELPVLAQQSGAIGAAKDQVLMLTRQARAALAAGQLEQAEQLARRASSLQVPNSAFGPRDDRPALVLLELSKARARNSGVVRAGGPIEVEGKYPVTQSVYDGQRDNTRTRTVSSSENFPDDPSSDLSPPGGDRLPETGGAPAQLPANDAQSLFDAGEQALRDRQPERALQYFRQAYAVRDQLNNNTAQRLQDHLQLLSASPNARQTPPRTLADSEAGKELRAQKQLSADLARQQDSARKLQERDPKRAGEILAQARATIEAAEVSSDVKAQLLRRVDLSQKELDKYIEDNRAQIELDAQNKETLSAVERRRQKKIDVDTKLAKLIDEYNALMEDRRWAEAEIVAKRASELDATNPVVKQISLTSKLARRMQLSTDVESRKEDGFVKAMLSVDEAGVPFDDQDPFRFPDAKKWSEVTNRSKKLAEKQGRTRRSEREIEIERKLKTPVSLSYRDVPLNEVLHQLAKLSAINLHLDPKGLAEEGVSPDQPVSIELNQDVSLKSALKLILEPLHLSYVIKDEVLKVTSEQLRDNEVYTVLYSVADLVIPIPNFAPNSRMGLQAALADSMGNMGAGGFSPAGGLGMGAPTAVLANQDGSTASGMINPTVLAQMNQMNPGARSNNGMPQQVPFGPGGMGGGQKADFDSLIELITSTIQPTTWDEVGGPGSIAEFATNLSLVISQTQEVHEQIVDLLEQLRRLQDLQVTIEVRFITLNDNFFERIGVDFQFNIENHATANPTTAPPPSMVVGLGPPAGAAAPFPNFTGDLDIPFRQSSFNLATPQFGQPVDVASFGFAILSDIEAFFLVNAAQGDRRSNVLQAPKVTLFNGQQAFVSDTSQTPFVISVIPVVGDFAAAQQPVIVVLNEGTFLTVQAVISNDRRFVRLTVVPFFSHIGDVQEFTFSGSKTTTKNTSSSNGKTAGGDTTSAGTDNETTTSDGVTVQLPTFSFVTVTTTVSVPDGGTVLLGGIKRLSEGRNEFGVPILSKLPYINRLFKNVGIGRETQSLMMMVTPRIIIQEEEEDRLGISAP